jgi:hypothetical protein
LRTLARSRVGSFDKMLDAAAALGFATAMDVSGVNIVGIEQQRDFARRGQLRWPRASALVEWHDGNIHTTNFLPAKSAVRYARWSNSPCAAASCDSTSPTKGEHSTRRPLAPRYRTLGGDGRSSLQSGSLNAWIFVVRPPRDRPIACSCSPLFRRRQSIDKVTLCLPQLTKASKAGPHRPRLDQRLKRL